MHFRMKCCLTVLTVFSYFLTSSARGCDTTVQRTVELPAILEFPTCRCAGDYSYTINGYDFEADRHRTFATCQAIFFATVYQFDQGNYTLKTGECEMTVCLYVNCKYVAISYTPILAPYKALILLYSVYRLHPQTYICKMNFVFVDFLYTLYCTCSWNRARNDIRHVYDASYCQ